MKAIKSTHFLTHRKSNLHQGDWCNKGVTKLHSTSTDRDVPLAQTDSNLFSLQVLKVQPHRSPLPTPDALVTRLLAAPCYSVWHFPWLLQMQNFLDTNEFPWKVSVSVNQLFLMKNDTDRNLSASSHTLDNLQELNSPLCFSILKQGNNTHLFFITFSEMYGQKQCVRAKYYYYLLFWASLRQ